MDDAVAPKELVQAIASKLTEEYGPPISRRLPEGLRLEVHPSVRGMLYRDPDLWPHMEDIDPAEKFEVPVRLSIDLPPGGWRLVIVTEDVLMGGTVHDRLP